MASTSGVLANVRVAYATGSPHTWRKLEQLSDCKVPTLEADDVETTTYGQSYKRRIPGLKDVNDLELTFLRDPTLSTAPYQNALFDYNANGTELWWRVEIHSDPDSTVDLWEAYEFQGRVASFEPSAEIGDADRLMSKIRFSGTSYVRYYPMASAIGA